MITDEMVEKARYGYFDAMYGSLERHTTVKGMRGALKAFAPMIRNAALEEAAGVARWASTAEAAAANIRAMKSPEFG